MLAVLRRAIAVALVATALPTLRAMITASAGATPGTQALVIRLEPRDFVLGAYQGRLEYERGSLQVLSLAASQRDNGTRLYNAADSAKGVIRFAGYTTAGFTSTTVLTLVVRPLKSLAAAKVRVELDVAGDLDGKSIPKDRLIPARGAHQ